MLKHSIHEERDGLLNSSSSSLEFEDSDYKAGPPRARGAYKPSPRPVWHYVLACLLLVALADATLLTYLARVFATAHVDTGVGALPLADPYVGLRELYALGRAPPERLPPLLNRPRVAAQVSRATPGEPARQGAHEVWDARMGRLAPADRRLLVDDETRTLVQFRAMDFGMEECALVLRLPGPGDTVEGADAPVLGSAALRLQVCPLDAPRALDPHATTWNARPRCAAPPTVFVAALGKEQEVLPRFTCAWGTYHAFEVACADGDGDGDGECLVDVWSSHNQTWGLYMYQHQTV